MDFVRCIYTGLLILTELFAIPGCIPGSSQHMYLENIVLLASVALVVSPVHVIFGCVQARGTCSPEISAIQ